MAGFHGNKILISLIDQFIKTFKCSSFVETGTYTGLTTKLVAIKYPNLPVFTSEVNEIYFKRADRFLKAFKNIAAFNESSEIVIKKLIEQSKLGDLPLFFLDAHWYDFWPLKDEMKIISELDRFIVIVDDFVVPGRPDFGSDPGGGGSLKFSGRKTKDTRPCDVNLIQESLNGCKVVYPLYERSEVPEASHFRGYCVISKGIDLGQPDKFHTWEVGQ